MNTVPRGAARRRLEQVEKVCTDGSARSARLGDVSAVRPVAGRLLLDIRLEFWSPVLGREFGPAGGSAGEELDAVVGAGCGVVSEGVLDADGVGRAHAVTDLVGGEPLNTAGLVGGGGLASDRAAAEDEGDDAARHVLVRAGEALDFDGDAGFFGDFAADAVFEGLVEFEDSAGGFPCGVVAALDGQDAAVVAYDDAGDADRMLRRAAHDPTFRLVARASRVARSQPTTLALVWTTGGVGVRLGSIDRQSDRPPYRQIADQLRAEIDAGRSRPGDRLPSEAELTRHYGVARMTARQAIQELRNEGRVVSEHGRGVFVRLPAPVRRLASDRFARKHREAGQAAFLAEAEKAGVRPTVDQIEVTRVSPAAEVRERLRLAEGAEVVSRSRRYLADGHPIEVAVSFIPLGLAEGTAIMETDTGPGGIYARLEEAGHLLDHFVEEVTARMPTAEERRRLELADGVPVLVVVRTAYDSTGTPVEVCDTVKSAPAYVLEYDVPAC